MTKPSTSSWQPPSTSTFLSLPYDALLAVFTYLSEEDLLNIAITNRIGCAAAIATLFRRTSPIAYDYQARWLNILFADNDSEALKALLTNPVYYDNLKARLQDTISTPIGLKIKIAICFVRFSDERQVYQNYINTAAAQNLDEVIPALYASCGQLHPERLANIQQLLFSIVDGGFGVFHRLSVAKTFAALAPQLSAEQLNEVLLKILLPLLSTSEANVIASVSKVLETFAPRLQLDKTLEQLLKLLEEDKQNKFSSGYESVKITRALVTLNPLISEQKQFEKLLEFLAPLLMSPTSELVFSTAKALAALSTAPVEGAFNRVIKKTLDPLLYGNYGRDHLHTAGFVMLHTLIATIQDQKQFNDILDILKLFTNAPENYLGCFARRQLAYTLEYLTLKVSTTQQASELQEALQSLSNDPDNVIKETVDRALKTLAANTPNKEKTTPLASTASLAETTTTFFPERLDKTKRATLNKLLSTAWQDLALGDLPLDKKVLIQTALDFIAKVKQKAAKKLRSTIDRLDLSQPYEQLKQALLQHLDQKQQANFLAVLKHEEQGRVETQFLSEVSKIAEQKIPTPDTYKQALQNLKLSGNSALFLSERYQFATTSPQASTSGLHPQQQ